MAVIPRFDGRIGQSLDTMSATPVGELYVPPARTSALEMAGQGIQGFMGDVAHIFQAEQERRAADYTTKSSAEIQEFVIREMDDAQKQALAAGNVDGFTENFLKRYDETVAKTLEGAPNDLGREALSERMMQARNSLLSQAMKFESSARIKIYESNLDKAADNYAKAAATNPSQIPQLMKQLEGDMAAATETLGLTDARDRMDFYKNQILGTAASQMMQSNPSAAMNFIEQYKDNLSAKNYVSLSKSAQYQQKVLVAQAEKARKDADDIAAVWGAVNEGIPLDPSSTGAQKAVDKMYNAVKQQDPNADFTEVVLKTNIMPQAMKHEIVGKLSNGTVDQKVEAAKQLQALHEAAPNLVDKITAGNKAKASMIAEYVDAGVPAQKAVEWAEQQTSAADEKVIKAREKAYRKTNLDFSSVQKKFTSWFGPGVDSIPDEMRAEYETLAKAYFVNEGLAADQAQENALRDIRATWRPSSVTGRTRYMKNAPESVYGNAAGTDWIKAQLGDDLSSHFLYESTKALKDDLKRVVLEANPYPDREGNTVYNVYKFDKDTGVLDVVHDASGEPILFKPDWARSSKYKEMLKEYPGESFDEKYQEYLKDAAIQRQHQEEWGQRPLFRFNDTSSVVIDTLMSETE